MTNINIDETIKNPASQVIIAALFGLATTTYRSSDNAHNPENERTQEREEDNTMKKKSWRGPTTATASPKNTLKNKTVSRPGARENNKALNTI